MGRPPLDRTDTTVKTTLRLPRKLCDRIYGFYGPQGMATFIRRAIEEKLEREEATLAASRRPRDSGSAEPG